jgi:predicted Ser/Thr protein kinase
MLLLFYITNKLLIIGIKEKLIIDFEQACNLQEPYFNKQCLLQ